MNIVCIICSELLRHEDIVTTTCGHVFHIKCIRDWLAGSTTCPSCRNHPTIRSNLIKLYLENDDTKGALNLEDILKTNDVLESENKALKEKQFVLEVQMKEVEQKMTELKDKERNLERQKHLDDLEIVGLRSIKLNSTCQIVKLNESLAKLKLDLLAEKELRRIHQAKLHKLDPQNENYNTASISDVESPRLIDGTPDGLKAAVVNASASPNSSLISSSFWKLDVDAKQATSDKLSQIFHNYMILKKAKCMAPTKLIRTKISDRTSDRPAGSPVAAPGPLCSKGPRPSTSAAIVSLPKKRAFGEKWNVPQIRMVSPVATTSTSASVVHVDPNNPTFPLVSLASNRPGPSRTRTKTPSNLIFDPILM